LGIKDPNKPFSAVFLGSSGTGKTHLAKQLAKQIFGSEDALIRLDMSEYQEKHSVSKLYGAPPGYAQADEGGFLTEQVKNKPYSVILFDEVEKAHKDVYTSLLQVLDDGHMTDGLGRKINFKNCLIIMTSNLGVRKLQEFGTGVGFTTSNKSYAQEEQKRDVLKKELQKFFAPEFLNRIDEVIFFNRLKREDVNKIVKLELDKLKIRIDNLKYFFTFDESLINMISEIGYDEMYGARPLKRAIQDKVEDHISEEILAGRLFENTQYLVSSENNEVKITKIEEEPKKRGRKKKGE
jgi:ATP-dependent Clp protease ATP-binding subunit ClpC